MTEREILTKKLAACQFMVHDLKLYLDTHPKDRETLEKLREHEAKLRPLQQQFEEKYGPLFAGDEKANKWKWINSPWPWENEEVD